MAIEIVSFPMKNMKDLSMVFCKTFTRPGRRKETQVVVACKILRFDRRFETLFLPRNMSIARNVGSILVYRCI